MLIRAARPDDAAAVRAVTRRAFPEGPEVALVDALEAGGHAGLSLVACDPAPVGFALFPIMAEPAGTLALGPVATVPERRREGVASALIREGLGRARADGWRGVFVLGDPAFYERFGFSAAVADGWRSPYAGPYFMACELEPGALAEGGRAVYPAPFADL